MQIEIICIIKGDRRAIKMNSNMSLVLEHGHFIILMDGKRVLVDTGSPVSFGNGVMFFDELLSNQSVYYQFLDIINQNYNKLGLTKKIDALIGLSTLINHKIIFGLKDGKVFVDTDGWKDRKCKITTSITSEGRLVSTIKVNGTKVDVIVDTGAWISYVPKAALNGLSPVGQYSDWNPNVNDFTGATYEASIEFENCIMTVEVGEMNDRVDSTLQCKGKGILSLSDVTYDYIELNLAKGEISFY